MTIDKDQEIKIRDERIKQLEYELDQAHEDQRQFLALLGHNLRVPINAICGFSQFIKNSMFGPIGQKYIEYAQDIEKASNDILALIENTITIFDDNLSLNEKYFSLNNLIQDILNNNSHSISGKDIELTIDIDDKILFYGDEIKISQMVTSILLNAIKYTHDGSIILSCMLDEQQNIIISCKDTGIGISNEDLDKVFNPFFKANKSSLTRVGYAGTGIGLTIVKIIAEKHDGKVKINSIKNEGTNVQIIFDQKRYKFIDTY